MAECSKPSISHVVVALAGLLCSVGCGMVPKSLPTVSNRFTASTQATDLPSQQPLADPTGKSAEIALQTALLAESRGMDREAVVAYLNLRKQRPDQAGLAHSLAVLYDRLGRVDDAAIEYRRALKETPNDVDLLCDHGYFQYSSGELEAAAKSFVRALEIDPEHRQTKINFAVLRAHQGDDAQAMNLFAESIGPAAARHNLGMIKLQQGDMNAARALLTEAAARDPSVAKRSNQVLASLEHSTTNIAGGEEPDSTTVRPAGFLRNEDTDFKLDAH
ncbi:tetratricopeptide repeat protein [Rhodopirellula sp. MGV]|uniref:tetratricopeptide repeat protein n=1 Tax=Rhodopirellula sp. MGV TaxID=2023130 RepID=UPI001179AEEC|nr:tetratricopeptide repeat protein [Rhodopirellula sp. MGV]